MADPEKKKPAAGRSAAAGERAPDFEAALAELEALVERMEQGELTLEQSVAHFERGMALSRACQSALDEARLKVDQLLADEGEETVPFQAGAGDGAGGSGTDGDVG